MGICNKTAGIISPLILGALVLKDANSIEEKINSGTTGAAKELLLQDLAHRVVGPYLVIAVVLVIVGIGIWLSPLPEIDESATDGNAKPEVFAEEYGASGPALAARARVAGPASTGFRIGDHPNLVLGMICILLYCGVEVMAGDAIGIYGRNQGLPLSVTKNFTSFTLGGMLIGYITGIFAIPKFLTQQMALRLSAIMGLVFTAGALMSTGYTSITFVALLGLANALMWPAIFPLGIAGLGKFTKTGSALMIMGIVGGGVMPLLYSTLKEKAGLSNSLAFFLCTFPCYLYIFYYAVSGYKTRQQRAGLALG